MRAPSTTISRCLRAVYARASYVTVNVSSPNTKGLRDLQSEEALSSLIGALKAEQKALSDRYGKYTPIAVKIAPDLTPQAIEGIARLLVRHAVDGVIATNTTIERDGVKGLPRADETGGLSGRPLRARATAVVAALAKALDGALPIIGVGGILSGADAKEKIDAGATLIQIYTGLIYRGPDLVAECARALAASVRPRAPDVRIPVADQARAEHEMRVGHGHGAPNESPIATSSYHAPLPSMPSPRVTTRPRLRALADPAAGSHRKPPASTPAMSSANAASSDGEIAPDAELEAAPAFRHETTAG